MEVITAPGTHPMRVRPRALLALEDGRTFLGRSFGAAGERGGEVVFNTAMTGYQEVLTDPSYSGQIVVMTYPEIGNCGVNFEDQESTHPYLEGFVVRNASSIYSNWRATGSLQDYLDLHGVVGICDVDTRALVRHLRTRGALRCMISTVDLTPESLVEKARSLPVMTGRDLASRVSSTESHEWPEQPAPADTKFHVLAYDFGIKENILHQLVQQGFQVTVVPAKTTAQEVEQLRPDGIFLSNGPGDPEPVIHSVRTIQKLLGRVPIFGICLGHQLLSLALGGRTYKLKFGHHGANHPVKNLQNQRVEITSQNHGFCVDPQTLDPEQVEITHLNLNDGTVEGLRHRRFPAFSVQYHPESSPGPHDSRYLFEEFRRLMREHPAWEK